MVFMSRDDWIRRKRRKRRKRRIREEKNKVWRGREGERSSHLEGGGREGGK